MLKFLRVLFSLVSVPAIIMALIVILAVESEPSLETKWRLTNQDIERAKQIFEGNPIEDNVKSIELNTRDLNIALNFLLNNYLKSYSKVTLSDTELDFKISLRLPKNLFGQYLNIQFQLGKQNDPLPIKSLVFGKIRVADEFAEYLIHKLIKYADLKQHYILVTEQILDYDFDSNTLKLTYVTDPSFSNITVDLLNKARDHQGMIYYRQKLTEVIDAHDPEWKLSLAELFQPLFKLAYRRSTLETAIKENRIVLFTVNSYVNKNEILPYLPSNVTAHPSRDYPVYIYKRNDMAKHFVASATLAATGGAHLASMLGQEKELSDARHGSGFSFIDLAGDRAGIKFGQMAVSSPENARKLQKYMSNIKDYKAFMPDMRDLPENLSQKKFKQQFFYVYTPQYQQMIKEIDDRIIALPLYKE